MTALLWECKPGGKPFHILTPLFTACSTGWTYDTSMIVEDEPNLGKQLKATLEGAGYAVDLSTDGEDGHFMGSTESYDAVSSILACRRSTG
jgi:hypothetical protein